MKKYSCILSVSSIFVFACMLSMPFMGFISEYAKALTLAPSVVTQGRIENNNVVSDADPDAEIPITANVLGSGNLTITWAHVTQDENSNPITRDSYNFGYRLVGAQSYIIVNIPENFNGYAFSPANGDYEAFIDVVYNGCSSARTIFTFTES